MSDDYAVFDGRFPVLSHDKCQTMIQERDAEIARLRAMFDVTTVDLVAEQTKCDRLRKQVAVARNSLGSLRRYVEYFPPENDIKQIVEGAWAELELDAIDAEAKNVSG